MFHTSHSLLRLHYERMEELRTRAATEAIVAAMNAEKRRATREAALAALKSVIEAKEEKATSAWLSQRRPFIASRLRGAR